MTTPDNNTLRLAREWADRVEQVKSDECSSALPTAVAAAEVIQSLPDEIVDADKLREVVADHHMDMSDELMEALGALLPTPPTMAEQPWDDAVHYLAEVEVAHGPLVVMLHKENDGYIVCLRGDTILAHPASFLTPTGKRYTLTPDGDMEGEAEREERAYAPGGVLTQDNLDKLNTPAEQVPFGNSEHAPDVVEPGDFTREITAVLNKYSAESISGTPDFILGEFVMGVLREFNEAVSHRAEWRNEPIDTPCLVPERARKTLTTEQDYKDAAVGAVVQSSRHNAHTWKKRDEDDWRNTNGDSLSDVEMSASAKGREVLWEPEV